MGGIDLSTWCEHDEVRITAINPERGRPVYRLLTSLFDEDVVTVRRNDTDDGSLPEDVALVEKDGGAGGFAVSSLDSIREELLFVNSDIYVTGCRQVTDVETPDVITHLDDISFTVTGYPTDPKEKLLLIEMSRHIESMAWRAGDGRIATGFQSLARLDDERGTRRVYARLGRETDVETHVYGTPDARPTLPQVTVHGETAAEIRDTWFVVYRSADQSEAAALVATQVDDHQWEGCWTYDSTRVGELLDHVDRTYH